MMFDRTLTARRAPVVATLVCCLAGCVMDPALPVAPRCSEADPRCPAGTTCRNGRCVAPSLAPDAALSDQAPTPDRASPLDRGAESAVDAATAPDRGNTCGNNRLDPGEPCDGAHLGGKSCKDLCYGGGTLGCHKTCKLDTSKCTPPTEMVLVPAKNKTFAMGSPETEIGREVNEDLHQVTLTRSFYMSPTEVTQEDFAKRMGYNPSWFQLKGHPVEDVLWHEAAAYCNALSVAAGLTPCYVKDTVSCPSLSMCKPPTEQACKDTRCTWLKTNPTYNTTVKTILDCPGYRLPTEAEWEFAYRAGTTTGTYAGELTMPGGKDPAVDRIGWFFQNSQSGKIHALVAQKEPNAYCLFDMAGNVSELTHDYARIYLGTSPVVDPVGESISGSRVGRGGCFGNAARWLRAASRSLIHTGFHNVGAGFRCVRSAP